MSQHLPYEGFKWVKNIDKIKQKLMNIKSNSSTKYILEVDLEYPHELHDIHNDYSLAPDKITIPKEWLSDYCLKTANAHNVTTGTVKKLEPNLMNKNDYVIHYRNWEQCLELEMKIKKIHRILSMNLIKKCEDAGIKNVKNPNAFIACSDTMDDVYEDIDNYNPKRNKKVLIVFDDMIADIMTNKRFQAIIKELFIRCRKLNISLVFITQSYFSVPKDVRLNSTHYLIMKINNRKELQNIAINHSADIDYKDSMKIYREFIKEPFIF